ncbi:MAG: S9 family peptidase, partial [Pseudomonadota bacterium]
MTKPPMRAHDLIVMPRLGSPTVSPDGVYAVYSVTYTDPDTLTRAPRHYLLDLRTPGSAPREFELGLAGHSLSFGPDNFLYFISSEHPDEEAEPRSRVWRIALEGNGNVTSPIPVADVPGTEIAGFKIAPSGDKIALWAAVGRNCKRFGCVPGREERGSGRLYVGDGGFYRHWDHWVEPDLINRVFVFDLMDGEAVGDGVAVDGGKGIGNTPTKPFGGAEDIAWAPDGSGVYFVARRADDAEPTSTDLDIYWSDLSSDAAVELTAENQAHDSNPAPSPDGKTLAYLAMDRPGYESDRMVVHLRNLETGEVRALTSATDLSFDGIAWSDDGKSIFATALDVLDVPAFRIDPKTGDVRELNLIAGNEAHIGNLTPIVGDRIVFTRDSIGVAP